MPIVLPAPDPSDTQASPAEALLPIDPFTALHLHYGMLLGVDDLETLEAYPRGKIRLHNAWLHRRGVVWGLGVELQADRGEVQVNRGLALDGTGHELHLDTAACVNVGAWFDAHKNDAGFTPKTTEKGVTFDVHVVIRFKACLARPVPAMADPCAGATSDVAYSRAQETVELFLRPNLAPAHSAPYHRLRVLFGLEQPRTVEGKPDPIDATILKRIDELRRKPAADQPRLFLEAFREYAALDGIELEPASTPGGPSSLFPAVDPTELVLANIPGLTLSGSPNNWTLSKPLPIPVIGVRRSHVATSTIQELLCGALQGGPANGGGPQVNAASVKLSADGKTLSFSTTGALAAKSVTQDALSLTAFTDAAGWKTLALQAPAVDGPGTGVTVTLTDVPPVGALVRLVVRGTGPAPVLGAGPQHSPLAGGNDFISMWTRS